jgi:hypothetical protein
MAPHPELRKEGDTIVMTTLQYADTALSEYQALAFRLKNAQDSIAPLEESRAALAGQAELAGKSTAIMPILDIFMESRWPLVGPMVSLPPSLMAIFLAFTSGLFGALLITLVLFVYPDDPRFSFSRSKSYGGRILLGGLIALGVFVLLFSGVAVLSGSETTGASQNLMAYAAIGILSGMFSDQAASWLSRRAHSAMPGDDASDAQTSRKPEAEEPI